MDNFAFRPAEEVQNASEINEDGIEAQCISARPCRRPWHCPCYLRQDLALDTYGLCNLLLVVDDTRSLGYSLNLSLNDPRENCQRLPLAPIYSFSLSSDMVRISNFFCSDLKIFLMGNQRHKLNAHIRFGTQ